MQRLFKDITSWVRGENKQQPADRVPSVVDPEGVANRRDYITQEPPPRKTSALPPDDNTSSESKTVAFGSSSEYTPIEDKQSSTSQASFQTPSTNFFGISAAFFSCCITPSKFTDTVSHYSRQRQTQGSRKTPHV